VHEVLRAMTAGRRDGGTRIALAIEGGPDSPAVSRLESDGSLLTAAFEAGRKALLSAFA
jgi:hypothetical protein